MSTILKGAAVSEEHMQRDIPRWTRPAGVQKRQPTVLFVDDCRWDSFIQLAGGLKRSGVRTVRITTSPRSIVSALHLFDRTIHLGAPSDLSNLPDLLEGEHIVDMQMTETVAAATNKGIVMMPESGRTDAWIRRVNAMDKTVVAERLREFGLSTPRILTGPVFDARQIVQELGLPVVRKPRTGSSGDGVSIIRSREELEVLIAEGQHTDDYFFERHVEGRALQFGGVFSGDDNDAVVTYETLQRRDTFAPASQIRMIADKGIAETGREVVGALGITGIMNINVIRDCDGRDWIHDVNPRVFGSFMAFRPRGRDLLQSYADWVIKSDQRGIVRPNLSVGSRILGDTVRSLATRTPGMPSAELPPDEKDSSSFLVFPAAFREKTDDHNPFRSMWGYFRSARPYVRWVGLRYIAFETALQLQFEWKRLWDKRGLRTAQTGTNPEYTLPHPAVPIT